MRRAHSDRYFSADTIAALCTPLGGSIAVIRVSGQNIRDLMISLCPGKNLVPRQAHYLPVLDPSKRLIDRALVLFFACPESFTGEDVLEFHTHASRAVVDHLLATLASLGVRQALPGEFSFRALKNGKLSLPQAQAVSDLIQSQDSISSSLALKKMDGLDQGIFKQIANDLRTTLALSEVEIDFSDQDLGETSLESYKKSLSEIARKIHSLLETFSRGQHLLTGIPVALSGAPNAGKSSLFNRLLGEARAIVTDIPGTTRDLLRETLILRDKKGSLHLRISDTAGIRSSIDPVEKIGIARSREEALNSFILWWLVDPSQPIEPQVSAYESLRFPPDRTLLIFSKSDLTAPSDRKSLSEKIPLPVHSRLWCSATSGEGIPELTSQTLSFLRAEFTPPENTVFLTREHHAETLKEALGHIQRALSCSEVEYFAADLRIALSSLAPLIGETHPDDILDKIIRDFCIGK